MMEHEIKKGESSFYIGKSETDFIAIIKYIDYGDNVIAATTTYVDESLRGQGIARKLLDELVAMARTENLKIFPICSYVASAFEKYPEYNDILQQGE